MDRPALIKMEQDWSGLFPLAADNEYQTSFFASIEQPYFPLSF